MNCIVFIMGDYKILSTPSTAFLYSLQRCSASIKTCSGIKLGWLYATSFETWIHEFNKATPLKYSQYVYVLHRTTSWFYFLLSKISAVTKSQKLDVEVMRTKLSFKLNGEIEREIWLRLDFSEREKLNMNLGIVEMAREELSCYKSFSKKHI